MAAKLIKPNTCGTCKFSRPITGLDGIRECRESSPSHHVVWGADPGAPHATVRGQFSSWPRVQVDEDCGKFTPRLQV